MKKILTLLFLISLYGGTAIAQNDSINKTDEQGWKQGKWVELSDGEDAQGCEAGTRLEEGYYKDNRKVGTWKKYWCSGKLKNELTYNADRSISSKDYFEDGKVKEEGTWNSVGWIGAYKMYHPNGKLYYEWNFDQSGKRTGRQKYYFDNGNVMFDGEWNQGKESGVIKEYYENGALKSEKFFNDGALDTNKVKIYPPKEVKPTEVKKVDPPKDEKPKQNNAQLGVINDGYNKTFTKEGKIDREGEFKNAKLYDGKQYLYKDGKVEKIAIVREGKVIRYETPKGDK